MEARTIWVVQSGESIVCHSRQSKPLNMSSADIAEFAVCYDEKPVSELIAVADERTCSIRFDTGVWPLFKIVLKNEHAYPAK